MLTRGRSRRRRRHVLDDPEPLLPVLFRLDDTAGPRQKGLDGLGRPRRRTYRQQRRRRRTSPTRRTDRGNSRFEGEVAFVLWSASRGSKLREWGVRRHGVGVGRPCGDKRPRLGGQIEKSLHCRQPPLHLLHSRLVGLESEMKATIERAQNVCVDLEGGEAELLQVLHLPDQLVSGGLLLGRLEHLDAAV